MNNTIVYLIGHYGVGKLTIGKAICAMTGARLAAERNAPMPTSANAPGLGPEAQSVCTAEPKT